jgi:transcriptional regulator with XRE-family HTH domain
MVSSTLVEPEEQGKIQRVGDSHEDLSVGRRLKTLRKEKGLSIRSLATKSGVSANTLSLIERERSSPSVSTLQRLAQSLQVPITAFFEDFADQHQIVYQQDGKRPGVFFRQCMLEDLGAGIPRLGAEPLKITLEPFANSGKLPIVHTGREFIYCLEGHIQYTIEDKVYLLGPRDSLLFDAFLPHRWENPDETPSSALLVLCPMDARDHPVERHFTR